MDANPQHAAAHLPVGRELRDDAIERDLRDCDRAAADEPAVGDADRVAVEIDEQTAGPTGLHLGVGLDVAIDGAAVTSAVLRAERAHDAERRAHRLAGTRDGDDEVTDPEAVEAAERRGGEALLLGSKEGDAGRRVATDDGGADRGAVGEAELDVFVALDDVVGGDDEIVGPDGSGASPAMAAVDADDVEGETLDEVGDVVGCEDVGAAAAHGGW